MFSGRKTFRLSKIVSNCVQQQTSTYYGRIRTLHNGQNAALLLQQLRPQIQQVAALRTATKAVPILQMQNRAASDIPITPLRDLNTFGAFSLKENCTHLRYTSISCWGLEANSDLNPHKEQARAFHALANRLQNDAIFLSRFESTKVPDTEPKLSLKEKLKRAVKEYGSTVIVFHVAISLASLGICYVLISSGVDVGKLLVPLGVSGTTGTAVANAGTFVTAYAIHKVFAPVRISITLGATPFIVRYLRRIGFLKKPKVP